MRQQHKIDTGGIETEVGGIIDSKLAAALMEPAVDQKAPPGALDEVAGPGDVAISAMKGQSQSISPSKDGIT
jgi:hypothetical protein